MNNVKTSLTFFIQGMKKVSAQNGMRKNIIKQVMTISDEQYDNLTSENSRLYSIQPSKWKKMTKNQRFRAHLEAMKNDLLAFKCEYELNNKNYTV